MIPLAVLMALLLTASFAHGSTVIATFNGVDPSATVSRSLDWGNWGSWDDVTVGVFKFDRTGGSYSEDLLPVGTTKFWAFCIEPQQTIRKDESYTYEVTSVADAPTNVTGGMGETKADQIAELLGTYYPKFGTSLTDTKAFALQIAIWEIVRETTSSLDVYEGSTRFWSYFQADALNLAQSYLGSIDGSGPRAVGLLALCNEAHQDALVQVVPIPGAVWLLGSGLLGLLGLRRRFVG